MNQESLFSGLLPRSTLSLLPVAALFTAVVLGMSGCTSPQEDIPPAVVRPVTAHGLTLDTTATPKQVAFVLLRSIVDDVEAAQAHDTARQKEALRLTHSLAAYSTIAGRIGESPDRPTETTRSRNRDRRLYAFVKDWAAIVAHYIRSFDTDVEAAGRRMVVANEGPHSIHLYYDVCHDPAETDPARQQTATIDIELSRESADGLSYWRVAKLAFAPPKAHAKPATATHTAPATAPQE